MEKISDMLQCVRRAKTTFDRQMEDLEISATSRLRIRSA